MEEFTSQVRRQAGQALVTLSGQEPTPGIDPILELIAFVSEVEAEEASLTREGDLTTEQWLAWNQLVMDRPDQAISAMSEVLELERTELPADLPAMKSWAAWLVLSTLDRLETE